MRIASLIGVVWIGAIAFLFGIVAPITVPLFVCSMIAAIIGFRSLK